MHNQKTFNELDNIKRLELLVHIDEDILRQIIRQENIVLIGSVSVKGVPNISPRYVLGVLQNDKLLFADAFENKTFHNINSWPKVTVAIFSREEQTGYQLKGEVEEVIDPNLISHAEARLHEFGIKEKAKKVWTLTVQEIYMLEPSAKSKNPIASAYS